MIRLLTDHPLAVDSDDHLHPDGVHLDNHCVPEFVDSVENYYSQAKINILDLGCAGGEFVANMISRGHTAVGLEGSDHCLNLKPQVLIKMGAMPLGYRNWSRLSNKNLFTCDVTYEYELLQDNKPMQFDLITCFDVMEHFYPERIDTFMEMVVKHLKPNGLFVANIALFQLIKSKILEPGEVDYHKSLFTVDEWLDKLSKYFSKVDYPFVGTYRGPFDTSGELSLIFAGKKV